MNYEKLSEFAMEIIANSGMSRSSSMEAIAYAKKNDFDNAKEKINEAEKFYALAHEAQNELIFKEARGEEKIETNILMVHAQDHLTMALMTKDIAKEFIDLYEKLGGR